ncbi:MAG: T9SS type A sorting domain-containing protein, partial [Paraprevotella sp.]|nr:T9SS type A sorting domain-containing protein [Paraprevotella sp.]
LTTSYETTSCAIASQLTESAAFYGSLTVTKKGSGVASAQTASAFSVRVQDGTIYVNGGAEVPLAVYNTAGQEIFHGVASQVSGLSKGLYIVKSGTATVKVLL